MKLGPYELDRTYAEDCLSGMEQLPDGCIDLTVTSPPYNCRKLYGEDDDQIPWPDYYEWLGRVLDQIYRVTRNGGVIAINIPGVVRWQVDHKYAHTWNDYDPDYKTHRRGEQVSGRGRIEPVGFRLFTMMEERDSHMREPIVWVKGTNGEAISVKYMMGSDNNPYMRPAHELILLGSKQHWHHRGGTGRRGADAVPYLEFTKDIWFIPSATSKAHPATFPVELPQRLVKLFIHAEDSVVFDPFMGIGSTAMAAALEDVRFLGFERVADYVRIANAQIHGDAMTFIELISG